MEYSELINEIDNLKDMLMLVESNVKHNINIYWTVMGFGLTLIGLISFGWLRYFVTKEVDKRLHEEVKTLLKDYVKVPESYAPTLLMGWTGDVRIWKDESNYVHIDGTVYGGIIKNNVIGLPREYRPLKDLDIPIICSIDSGYCTIGTDGYVTIIAKQGAIIRFNDLKFKVA